MNRQVLKAVVLFSFVVLISGCNTAQIKQDAANAWDRVSTSVVEFSTKLGEQINIALNPNDQRTVEQKTQEALNSAGDGQSVSVIGENVQGNIRAVRTRQETRNMEMARVKTVDAPKNLELMGALHEATAPSINVRKGPSTQRPIITAISKGQRITAVGSVSNGKWILVAQDGTAFGYVYHSLLKEVPASNIAQQSQQTEEDVVDLDALFEEEGTVVEEVVAVTECRDLKADLKTSHEDTSSEFTACKGADGVWEI